jgi:hypothetical protein
MRGGTWWDERLREIRSSSPYKQREDEVVRRRRRVVSKSPSRESSSRTQLSSGTQLSASPDKLRPKRSISPSIMLALDGRAQRDSQAWRDMLHSTGPCKDLLSQRSSPEQQHVKAVLKKLQAGWLGLRKVLSAQARAANVDQIEDFSIGFDDFAAAVEAAGMSATRMQAKFSEVLS